MTIRSNPILPTILPLPAAPEGRGGGAAIEDDGMAGDGADQSQDNRDLASREAAMKARAERVVAALVDSISAPIEASEFAALEGPETATAARRPKAPPLA